MEWLVKFMRYVLKSAGTDDYASYAKQFVDNMITAVLEAPAFAEKVDEIVERKLDKMGTEMMAAVNPIAGEDDALPALPSEDEKTEPATEPEPEPKKEPAPKAEAVGAAKPSGESLRDKMNRMNQANADREQARNKAYQDLVQAFKDNGLAFDHEADASDVSGRLGQTAIRYLQFEVVNGRMTVDEAVQFAIGQENWTRPLDEFEKMLNAMRELGFGLKREGHENGDVVNVHEMYRGYVESGELTSVEDLIEMAKLGGLLFHYDDRVTIGQAIREKAQAEADQERRDQAAKGNPPKRRRRGSN